MRGNVFVLRLIVQSVCYCWWLAPSSILMATLTSPAQGFGTIYSSSHFWDWANFISNSCHHIKSRIKSSGLAFSLTTLAMLVHDKKRSFQMFQCFRLIVAIWSDTDYYNRPCPRTDPTCTRCQTWCSSPLRSTRLGLGGSPPHLNLPTTGTTPELPHMGPSGVMNHLLTSSRRMLSMSTFMMFSTWSGKILLVFQVKLKRVPKMSKSKKISFDSNKKRHLN